MKKSSLCSKSLLLFLFTVTALSDVSLFSSSDNAPYDSVPRVEAKDENKVTKKSFANLSSHNAKSRLRSLAGDEWRGALADYRDKHMVEAAQKFIAIAEMEDTLSDSDRTAAAFWAYRALSQDHQDERAALYLKLAATMDEQGFYGMIARHINGNQAISPQVQMTLALEYLSQEDTKDASYVLPQWKPARGYKVDPALLFAIMRQESDFRPDVVSSSGAVGVMQLMPDTANAMAKNLNLKGRISDPEISMALGQHYISRLMHLSDVGDNLIFVTAAYNAGPVLVHKWQNNLDYNDDPLTFIESIPYGTTRDYVINVLSNYWVYSGLLGNMPDSLAAIASGQWPVYSGLPKHLASEEPASKREE